jgi:hypothetical protein
MVTQGWKKRNISDAGASHFWLMFCRVLLVLVIVTVHWSRLSAQDGPRSLRSEFLMELRADLDEPSQDPKSPFPGESSLVTL